MINLILSGSKELVEVSKYKKLGFKRNIFFCKKNVKIVVVGSVRRIRNNIIYNILLLENTANREYRNNVGVQC